MRILAENKTVLAHNDFFRNSEKCRNTNVGDTHKQVYLDFYDEKSLR